MDLVLHAETALQLKRLRSNPPHAVILVGSPGTGKSLLARQLSSELLESSEKSLENNPYYKQLTPVKGMIPIESIRSLLQFFSLSVPGKNNIKRVACIIDADAMGTEAQNALLKLLEEPPAGSVLILTSSRPLGLLPTIRSRLQSITVADPGILQLSEYFEARGFARETVERAIVRHGNNIAAIRDALNPETGTSEDPTLDVAKQLLAGDRYQRMLKVNALAKDKEFAKSVLDTLLTVASAGLETAARKPAPQIERWLGVLRATETARDALEKNGNPKLVLSELMLSL